MTRVAAGMDSASPNATLHHALRAVTRRERWQRALDAFVVLATVVSALMIVGTLALDAIAPLAWWSALAVPCLGALAWAARPVAPLPIARAIDTALSTPDLVASAVSFAALPGQAQTPFMRACIAQAQLASARLVPARALELHAPRALPVLCALALLLIGLSHEAARAPVATLTEKPPAAPVLEAESTAAFARELDALRAQPLDPAAQEIVNKLNALLEGIASGEIDRAQALAELSRLEQRLEGLLADDPEALAAALEQIGRALSGTPEAKPLEKALQQDWPEAANELRHLSERIQKQELKAAAQERLASSLARAAEHSSAGEQQGAIDQAKRELDRLLRQEAQQRVQGKPSREQDERLLKRKQRELDQLQRDQAQRQAADRQLDQLQRELDAASKALSENNRESAADKLRKAAEQIERAAQQQAQRSQAGKLSEQLAQLRAEIAQRSAQASRGSERSSNGGSPMPLSMQRFGRMAQGKPGSPDRPGGQQQAVAAGPPAQDGEPSEGEGEGRRSPGERLAQLREAQGQGQGEGQHPERAARMEHASGPSDEPGVGSGAGQGGTPKSGPATAGTGQHVDTRLEGEKRAGPSRSEVIFESGQRGFANESYAKVHEDYVRHAESVLEREHIPGGYRYYVRRYFQLIRPREGAPAGRAEP